MKIYEIYIYIGLCGTVRVSQSATNSTNELEYVGKKGSVSTHACFVGLQGVYDGRQKQHEPRHKRTREHNIVKARDEEGRAKGAKK